MATNKSLQLLRNTTPSASMQAAWAAMSGATSQDGVPVLGRYTQDGKVLTSFGIEHAVGGETGMTYFYNAYEIDAMIGGEGGNVREYIESLVGSGVTSANTVTSQLETLSGMVANMDYTGVTTGDGVVITNVTEEDGVVSATPAEVGGLKLTEYVQGSDSGAVASTDTINAAFAKLQNQIVAQNNVIDALDYEDAAVAGQYVSQVTQTDGKIAVSRVELPSLAEVHEAGKPIVAVSEDKGQVAASAGTINAEFVNVTGDTFSSTTVQAALEEIDAAYKAADAVIVGDASESGNSLGKLEDRIEELADEAKEYHIVKTTTGLPETIKERYSLVDAAGNVSGDTVDIPKDSHIVSITYDGTTQKLTYNYIDASGNTQSTDVDMSELVLETEFGSGVTVTDHVAHGVVDPTSETFLTVGADGFKLSGVQDAIDTAIQALDVTDDTAVAGQYVAAIEETDGVVAVKTRENVSEAVLNNYTKGSDASDVAATDTINEAISKLENQIDAVETQAAASKTLVDKASSATHLTISSAIDATNSALTFTIGEEDIASASALTAEIAARKAVDGQNGETYAANTGANYISNATSLNDADVKLDTQLKAEQDEIDAIETAVGLDENGDYVAGDGRYTSGAQSVAEAVDALDDQVAANADAIAELTSGTTDLIDALSGKAVTVITSTDGSLSATSATATDGTVSYDLHTDASQIKMTGFNPVATTADTAPAATDSVAEAMSKLYAIAKHHHLSGSSAIEVAQATDGATVSLKLDDETTTNTADAQYVATNGDNVLQIKSDGLYLDSCWDCGTF